MVEPVIAIGVGFFIIMCMMVKFTGINTIPDIEDNTDDTYDDIQNTSEQNNQYKIIQNFEDVSINCIDVSIDTDIINSCKLYHHTHNNKKSYTYYNNWFYHNF